jgi:hypothetical protein
VLVFGFNLDGFVEEVCFLFFSVFLRVVIKGGGFGPKVTFYVTAF